ncbi:helix-turn-helix domain-containing protein [Poriferisphaera sp. WC338]|uniref:helix-turn-helix transcriptional regulator n=1 Tax=Poriferisphaera sp. WC338 TaxID=3425129 RepID=UPI003D81339F
MKHAITPIQTSTEIRASVEVLASRYAAIRAGDGESVEPLLAIFDEMMLIAKTSDYIRFFDVDRRLHLQIVRMADVEGLEEVWGIARKLQEKFHIGTLQTCWPDLQILFESHRPLVDTICNGDPIAAQNAARDHLQAIWYRIAEQANDPSLPNDAVSRVTAYIAFHFQDTLTIKFLAKHIAGVTEGHLARLFRAAHGLSISTYICNLRMYKAASLLELSELPISQIAQQVGYNDGSRFSEHFKRQYSISPSQFRQKQKVQATVHSLSLL